MSLIHEEVIITNITVGVVYSNDLVNHASNSCRLRIQELISCGFSKFMAVDVEYKGCYALPGGCKLCCSKSKILHFIGFRLTLEWKEGEGWAATRCWGALSL